MFVTKMCNVALRRWFDYGLLPADCLKLKDILRTQEMSKSKMSATPQLHNRQPNT